MAGRTTDIAYKKQYEAAEKRWQDLRAKLQTSIEVMDETGETRVNVDKTTVLQILFLMDTMEPSSEDHE